MEFNSNNHDGFEDEEYPFIDYPRNKKKDIPGLERFGNDLTMEARMGKMDPVIGRTKQTQELIEVLCRRRKNNAVLLGEPGVGKTAVAEGLAQKIANGNVPTRLLSKRIISLDLSLMIAGTRYRGEFEARLKKVIDEAKADTDVILVIDEMHNLIGAGSAEGAMDAANILKPPLARGELQCIGATTRDEYKRYVEKDPALQRRFQPIIVPEPTIEETVEILKGLRDAYEIFHNVKVKDEALWAAAQFSSQYIADRFLPDKAIDLLDQSGARASLQLNTKDENYAFIETEREAIRCVYLLKCEALRRGDIELIKPLNDLEESWRVDVLRFIFEKQLEQERNELEPDEQEILDNLYLENLFSQRTTNLENLEINDPNFPSKKGDLKSKYVIEEDDSFEGAVKKFTYEYVTEIYKLYEEKENKKNQSDKKKISKLGPKHGWLDPKTNQWHVPKSEKELDDFLDSLFKIKPEQKKEIDSEREEKYFEPEEEENFEIEENFETEENFEKISNLNEYIDYQIEQLLDVFNEFIFISSPIKLEELIDLYFVALEKQEKLDEKEFLEKFSISSVLGQEIFKKLVNKKLKNYPYFSEIQKSIAKDYLVYIFKIYKKKIKLLNKKQKKSKSNPIEIWNRLMKEVNSIRAKREKKVILQMEEMEKEGNGFSFQGLISLVVDNLRKFFLPGPPDSDEFQDPNLKNIIDYYKDDGIPGTIKSVERTREIAKLMEELPKQIDWVELVADPENPKFEGKYLHNSIYYQVEKILNAGSFTEEEKQVIKSRMSVQEIAREIREKYSFLARMAEKFHFEKSGKKSENLLDYSDNIRELEAEEELEEEQVKLLNEKIRELFGPDSEPVFNNTESPTKRFKPIIEREVLEDLRFEAPTKIPDHIFEKICFEINDPGSIRRNETIRETKKSDENTEKANSLLRPVIGKNEIAELIAIQTGVPITDLTEDETEKLQNLESVLHERVIGQNEAVDAVANAVRRARLGIRNPKKPIASFMFCGPTGVGKTELTKTLASVMFGSEDSVIRLDMSEYMEKHAVAQLLGAPPGYIGYAEGGQLTEKVRRKPYSVVLFDEIEKAHSDILDILLQLLDDGRLTDAQGRTISFKNTIIILTSNVGAQQVQDHILANESKNYQEITPEEKKKNKDSLFGKPKIETNIGFIKKSDLNNRLFLQEEVKVDSENQKEPEEGEQDYLELRNKVFEELRLYYRPEFLNRLDDVIVFKQLSKKEVRQIADIMVKDLIKRLKEQGFILEVTEAAKDLLLTEGYDPFFGARPMRRAITRCIEDGVSETMLGLDLKPGATIIVDLDPEDNTRFKFKAIPQPPEVK